MRSTRLLQRCAHCPCLAAGREGVDRPLPELLLPARRQQLRNAASATVHAKARPTHSLVQILRFDNLQQRLQESRAAVSVEQLWTLQRGEVPLSFQGNPENLASIGSKTSRAPAAHNASSSAPRRCVDRRGGRLRCRRSRARPQTCPRRAARRGRTLDS